MFGDFMLKYDECMITIAEWMAYYESPHYDETMLNLENSDKINIIINMTMRRVSFNDMKCITFFIKMWSDDFDPSKSVKSNRQSI